LSKVIAFHQQPSSLGAITPPPVRVELLKAPEPLSKGGEMVFKLWLGPFPIPWVAMLEDSSEAGFSDRQMSGPFAEWVHRHSFVRIDEEKTEVIDQITLRLKAHLLWGPVGGAFVLGLPVMFAYRTWKTRRLLEGGEAA
jgi:ligand-binding SRPBCC domain-containing protein